MVFTCTLGPPVSRWRASKAAMSMVQLWRMHQPFNVLRLELPGRSAARPIGRRGHACLAPVGVRDAHCAHVQVQLARHLLSKNARVQ